MEFKFLKNISPSDSEKNYYEFLFRRMFKNLLVRKTLLKKLTLLEQGDTYTLELYTSVYMKIYKLTTKTEANIGISGGVYDSSKEIYYYFNFSGNDINGFTLRVECPINKYKGLSIEKTYSSRDKKKIYLRLEKDLLTWS